MKQNHEFKIGDLGKAKNELAVWKEKMNKLREEKAYLNLKVIYIHILFMMHLFKQNKEAVEEKNDLLGRIENLKNKFQSLVKKNKEFANLLDELEAKKDKIEQKNAGFSKIIDEVNLFKKYIFYLFVNKL